VSPLISSIKKILNPIILEMLCVDKFSVQTVCDRSQISITAWNIRRYLILLELSAGNSGALEQAWIGAI